MTIICFSTSNSSKSISRDLVNYAHHLIQSTNQSQILDLREFDAPIYSPDLESKNGIPTSIKKLNQIIAKSDSLIISLNEHNGYPPAFFKNILDWLTREKHQFLANKKVILLSTSPGQKGGESSLNAMKNTLPIFGATIVDALSVASFHQVFQNEKLIDEKLNAKLKAAIQKIS